MRAKNITNGLVYEFRWQSPCPVFISMNMQPVTNSETNTNSEPAYLRNMFETP